MHELLATIFLLTATPAPDDLREGTVEMRRARDGNIAIREELEAARTAATVAAYDLFIARHPDHPLAKIAREERQRLIDRHKGHHAD
jgi:hypothetical protein